MASWLAVAGIALAFGLVFTRLFRGAARRLGLVDAPDGRRKIQKLPVPLAGGVAVLAATAAALLTAAQLLPDVRTALADHLAPGLALFAAAAVIAAVGLLDDAVTLRARYKLAGQLLAIAVLVGPAHLLIERVSLFGVTLELGVLAVPVTFLWFLAAINALNLLDGMDGLLGTIGVVVLATFAGIAALVGQPFALYVALALAGALAGFLRYNLPPATVYLGDCGSMLIGLVVAALSIQSSMKSHAVALIVPAAVLVLPFLDTAAAIVRRKLTGRGLAAPDRGHLHHVLMQTSGMSIRRVLLLVAALGGVASCGAVASIAMHNDLVAVFTTAAVALILIVGRLFGHAEVRLLKEKALAALRTARGRAGRSLEVRLQGDAAWGEVWQEVTAVADRLNVQTVCLDVNAPAWHESYHARWDRVGPAAPPHEVWRVEMPLFGDGQAIGRLTVVGRRDADPLAEKLAVLSKIVDTAEVSAERLVPSRRPAAVRPRPAAVSA